LSGLLKETGTRAIQDPKSVILSIFPHKNDPEITGSLLAALGNEGEGPKAWANSPSAISIVMKEDHLNRASAALFGPFSFSAYRTPEDWKLAQKGKEKLYKEVVASYQEKQPKIYGLSVQENQELVQIEADEADMGRLGKAFEEFGRLGLNLTFLTTGPCQDPGKGLLAFCLPRSEEPSLSGVVKGIVTHTVAENRSPVATFSMNGPHFGDRYGIASGLISIFQNNGIELLGLNCTIASIIGVVPSEQTESAIEALQAYFEIPTIIRKD
jgi:aspartokinase